MSEHEAPTDPFASEPTAASHPDHLAIAAAAHARSPAFPATASVLELACGDGANIVPMAFHRPDARFVGVETSPGLAAAARRSAELLGVRNTEFVTGGLDVLESRRERYDYVIVHDVLSSLSPAEAARTLDLCAASLSPEGVMYLDYAAEAGWLLRSRLRDLIRRHVGPIPTVAERLQATRQLLAALEYDGVEEKLPHSFIAKLEVRVALSLSDRLLGKLVLAPYARSFRRSEISALLRAHGLDDVDDGWDPSPERLVEANLKARLGALVPNQAEAQDLAELMTGPQFRAVVACAAATSTRQAVSLVTLLDQGTFTSSLQTRLKDVLLDDGIEVAFVSGAGQMVRSKEPVGKAILTVLANASPAGAQLSHVLREAAAMLRERLPGHRELSADDLARQARELVALHAMGAISWSSREARVAASPPERPSVFAVNIWQARRGYLLTDPKHRTVVVDEFTRQLVKLLDGTRDEAALIEAMLSKVAQGALVVGAGAKGGKAEAPETLVPRIVHDAIAGLTRAGVVEA